MKPETDIQTAVTRLVQVLARNGVDLGTDPGLLDLLHAGEKEVRRIATAKSVKQAVVDEMKRQGLNKHRLAKKSGVRHTTIQDFMTEKRQPRIDTITRIFAGLDLELTVSRKPEKELIAQ